MKRVLAIAGLALLTLGFVRQQQAPSYRVVFDLTSRDSLEQKALLRWLKEITVSNPKAQLEVVMYGRGFELVMPERSAFITDVQEAMKNPNISFKVCEIALRNNGVDKSQLAPGVQTVPEWDLRDHLQTAGTLGLHKGHALIGVAKSGVRLLHRSSRFVGALVRTALLEQLDRRVRFRRPRPQTIERELRRLPGPDIDADVVVVLFGRCALPIEILGVVGGHVVVRPAGENRILGDMLAT